MRTRPFTIVASAVLTMISEAALAKGDPVVLEPSSGWEFDTNDGDDSCALRRMFDGADGRVQLEMRRYSPMATEMQMTVLADEWKPDSSGIKYRFKAEEEWRDAGGPIYSRRGKDFQGLVFDTSIFPPTIEEQRLTEGQSIQTFKIDAGRQFAAASGFSVKDGFKRDFTLKTGSLLTAHLALEDCLEKLLVRWGIDPVAHRTLSRLAAPQDMKAVAGRVANLYPAKMLARGISGVVRIRLGVDKVGQVSECHVQFNLTLPDFKQAACMTLLKAKFEPALDKDGNPVASYWMTSVIYTTN